MSKKWEIVAVENQNGSTGWSSRDNYRLRRAQHESDIGTAWMMTIFTQWQALRLKLKWHGCRMIVSKDRETKDSPRYWFRRQKKIS